MHCQFCGQDIKKGSALCDWCGRRQEEPTSPPEIESPKPQEAQPPPPAQPTRPGPPPLETRGIGGPPSPPASETVPPQQMPTSPPSAEEPKPFSKQWFLTIKEYFRWSEVRAVLKRDPVMLAVFIILGLGALVALGNVAIRGPGLLDMLPIMGFFGVISWRMWGWVLAMFSYGVGAVFIVPAAISLVYEPGFTTLVMFLQVAMCAFVAVVLWKRRDYFD